MSGMALRETLGFLGVMASLVFVGLEIRQNTALARATAFNDLSVGSREYFLGSCYPKDENIYPFPNLSHSS